MTRMWWYTLGVLVLWVVNPELRRLFVWRFGAGPDVFPLLPFIAVIPHFWSLTLGGGWERLPRLLLIAAWVWLGAFGYALAVALVNANVYAGMYDFLNFVLPVGVGLWLAADGASFLQGYTRLTRLLFGLTTVISVYGIVQYVVAPPWDTLWLQGVIATGSTSFGRPAPFLIRVWSMLASPGPFGNFMALMLLLALPQLSLRRPWLLAQVPVWLVAFGLSLDRSGWLMFASGAVVYLILTPRRGPLLVSAALSTALLTGLFVLLPAATGNSAVVTSLSDRFATLSDLETDQSANDRRNLYDSGLAMVSETPFGRGLGVVGTATKLGDAEATTSLDSGFLSRLVEMGLPGFALYIFALGVVAWTIFGIWRRAGRLRDYRLQSVAAMALAVVLALAGAELSGDINGLLLLSMWLFTGLAVGNPPAAPAREVQFARVERRTYSAKSRTFGIG